MRRSWYGGFLAALSCALPAVAGAQAAASSADAGATVNAVWLQHEVNFTYMGRTSYYSCDGLRTKVTWILEQLGAKPGFQVSTRGCVNLSGPDMFPGVRIEAALPAAATPELLAQLAADASKRQLAARAAGQPEPVVEATAQFPARVKRVRFASTPGTLDELQNGDCELMEQLRDRAFGELGVKVIEDQVRCVPGQVTLGAVRMTVEVLEPVPPPATK